MVKFWGYKSCSTCRNTKKMLMALDVEFEEIDIVLQPPSKKILKLILRSGDYSIKSLLNRSGLVYREMNLKDKLKDLSEDQILDLLSKNGKLIKRPIIDADGFYTVGYDEGRLKILGE